MKLKALESNFPCRCGHAEARHGKTQGVNWCYKCVELYLNARATSYEYKYEHEFMADTLRYLEELSDK